MERKNIILLEEFLKKDYVIDELKLALNNFLYVLEGNLIKCNNCKNIKTKDNFYYDTNSKRYKKMCKSCIKEKHFTEKIECTCKKIVLKQYLKKHTLSKLHTRRLELINI